MGKLIPLGKLKRLLFIALLVVFACKDKEKEPVRKPYIPS
jgi:hypothetical protein